MVFDGINKDHITVTPKFTHNESLFPSSMNFASAKIKQHGRFLGLVSRLEFTELVVGVNHPESGVQVEKVIHIEDVPEVQCFDVDEIINRRANKTYAILDCGVFENGRLASNEFIFVDLDNYKVVIGTKESDVFVEFSRLERRHIEIVEDPFNNLEYMYRFITSNAVGDEHKHNTYVEIFLLGQTHMDFRLFDVIDHTFFELPSLSILDYQIHFNLVYLLVRDHGLVQLRVTPNQHVQIRSYMNIKLNVQRFVVHQNGFNDDLHVAVANDNTIYQFEWDVASPPTLVNKYALMAGSEVEKMVMDDHLIIVQARAKVDEGIDRRVWVFSRRTASFTNAYAAFKISPMGPHFLIYENAIRSLHFITSTASYNIRFSLPYLNINPVTSERAGTTEDYVITGTSETPDGKKISCKQTLHLQYIENSDTSIFKTGLHFGGERRVDSPDEVSIDLQY